MATMEQFGIMLAEVEADIGKAEASVRELRAVARYLHKRMDAHAENSPLLPGVENNVEKVKPYVKMKLPAAMEVVLQERGAPMHMKDIAKALVNGGYKDRASLGVSVASTAGRRADIFKKVGAATYALRNGEPEE